MIDLWSLARGCLAAIGFTSGLRQKHSVFEVGKLNLFRKLLKESGLAGDHLREVGDQFGCLQLLPQCQLGEFAFLLLHFGATGVFQVTLDNHVMLKREAFAQSMTNGGCRT